AQDIHRALASLQEELEAVDWYNQRVDVTEDEALKAILEHNRNEEIEHACMALEYLRRNFPVFDEHMGIYLFKSAPITELEELAEAGEEEGEGAEGENSANDAAGLGVGTNS
ncbi:MAG: encapsulin-associated ferritin-like protein, partial [Lentisphaeria bacterium]